MDEAEEANGSTGPPFTAEFRPLELAPIAGASFEESTDDHRNAAADGPPPIDQTDRNQVLAVIRDVFSSGEPRDKDQAIRDVAHALGYRRTGSTIQDILGRDMFTAVLRGILENDHGQYCLLCRNIDQYTLGHLVEMLMAAMGGNWQTREEAITAAARHLGYRRTGSQIQKAFKSAINAALRRGLLERDGPDRIRKAR